MGTNRCPLNSAEVPESVSWEPIGAVVRNRCSNTKSVPSITRRGGRSSAARQGGRRSWIRRPLNGLKVFGPWATHGPGLSSCSVHYFSGGEWRRGHIRCSVRLGALTLQLGALSPDAGELSYSKATSPVAAFSCEYPGLLSLFSISAPIATVLPTFAI